MLSRLVKFLKGESVLLDSDDGMTFSSGGGFSFRRALGGSTYDKDTWSFINEDGDFVMGKKPEDESQGSGPVLAVDPVYVLGGTFILALLLIIGGTVLCCTAGQRKQFPNEQGSTSVLNLF